MKNSAGIVKTNDPESALEMNWNSEFDQKRSEDEYIGGGSVLNRF
jgi:hypothetical protein